MDEDTRGAPEEISISELRKALAQYVHDVAILNRTVYITTHGRRVAAIVPLTDVRMDLRGRQ